MRTTLAFLFCLLLSHLVSAESLKPSTSAEARDLESAIAQAAAPTLSHRAAAGNAAGSATRSLGLVPGSLERQELTPGVARYRFDVTVGAGDNDRIRLHRIVRELAPWIPARAARGVLLAHGDGWGFDATFLTPATGPDANLSIFLAERGIDVWGLDFRWALVPEDVTDFAFLEDWGFDVSLSDLDTALAVARATRLLTGSGLSKLQLLGFSRGGQIGWAQVAAETRLPRWRRHVRSFLPVEQTFKTDQAAIRDGNCASYDGLLDQIAGGSLVTDFRVVAQIGDLALAAPGDPSPFLPSLDNADLAEWIGASAAGGSIPAFHSVGGLVDPVTLETELLYTEPTTWFSFLSQISPYQPLRINLDGAALVCDALDSPYDDHLSAVDIPVFYLGVGGAFGGFGIHATTLIASADVASLIVSQSAVAEEDLGHNEPFLASDAATLFWQPILDWLSTR